MKSIPYQLQRLFIHLQVMVCLCVCIHPLLFGHVQTSTKRAVETTGVTKSFGWDSSEGVCIDVFGHVFGHVVVMWYGVCSVAAA